MKQSYTNIWNRCWAFGLLSLLPFAASAQSEDVQTLSPFEVSASEDFGYRVTNAQTTTRIGAPIFETPMNIQVLSEEFLKDTNLGNQIHEVLRYTAATSMDTQMGILQPGTNFTPSGVMSIRGFPVSLRLQDNVFRYIGYNADIVDRIEIVKGPAATFYGKGYPGGVINYVTKSAQLAELPTLFSYRYGTYEDHKLQIDNNTLLRDNLALRTILVLHNAEGQNINEYLHTQTVFNSLRWQINDRLSLLGRVEFHERKENRNNYAWIWPEEYFSSYANPSQALLDAHQARYATGGSVESYRADIRLNNNFGRWLTSYRDVNPGFTPYYALNSGPTFERMAGLMTNGSPDKWNSWGRDDYAHHMIENYNVALDWRATDWMDVRFSVNTEKAKYDERRAQTRPNADGITFHTLRGPTWRDYEQNTSNYMVDAVLSHEIGPLESKLLLGYTYRSYRSEFGGTAIGFGIYDFRQVPGYPADGAGQSTGPTAASFALQGLIDENGNQLTPQQVYQEWNPALHPQPALSVISQTRRTLRDRYVPIEKEAYISYQGTLWDRLHLTAGYRTESRDPNGGQWVDANPPWFTGFPNMIGTLDPSQWAAYSLSESYQLSTLTNTRAGDSYMFGGMYEITPEISVYASVSQSYRPNRGRLANWDDNIVRDNVQRFINENPGQTTFTSPQGEVDRLYATAPDAKNETGDNYEVGVKTILWEGKLDLTASLFRLERANRYVDDSDRSALREPLNQITFADGTNPGRLVRWFTNEAFERSEGVEVEAIWTPNPQYQLKVSASNLWEAAVIEDPSLPATAIQFQRRLPNAPKVRFNVWNKYTFTEGSLEGFSVAGGGRYSSKLEISNTSDQWASNLGGDYFVFDGMVSYSTQVAEIPTVLRLNVTNIFDKKYSEGGWNLARGRELFLTTEMRF